MTVYAGTKNFTAYTGDPVSLVKPTDLSALPAHDADDATINALRNVFLTNCKYVIAQMPTVTVGVGEQITGVGQHNYGARPAAEGLCGVSVAIATGIWDEEITGVSEGVAIERCKDCITAMYSKYLYCESHSQQSWYYDWQAASWAASFGRSVWHLWGHLSGTQKRYSAYVIEAEANRILTEYTTEYWVITTGDSKGETVAWNATILQIAQAMMPQHANAHLWRAKEIEMELAALSRPSDMTSADVVDGYVVGDVVTGYNVPEDGALINHSKVHPDYMQACIMFLQQAKLVYLFSPVTEPNACNRHCELQWQVLTSRVWDTATYYEPGGTVYAQDGSYHLYYPEGNDWADNDIRQDIYLLADVHALKAGWNSNTSASASSWILSRVAQIAAMQARFETGQTYADGEYDSFPPREQFACWQLGDAYLAYRGL